MVYKGKPLWFIKMDDLGVPPYFWKHPFISIHIHCSFYRKTLGCSMTIFSVMKIQKGCINIRIYVGCGALRYQHPWPCNSGESSSKMLFASNPSSLQVAQTKHGQRCTQRTLRTPWNWQILAHVRLMRAKDQQRLTASLEPTLQNHFQHDFGGFMASRRLGTLFSQKPQTSHMNSEWLCRSQIHFRNRRKVCIMMIQSIRGLFKEVPKVGAKVFFLLQGRKGCLQVPSRTIILLAYDGELFQQLQKVKRSYKPQDSGFQIIISLL